MRSRRDVRGLVLVAWFPLGMRLQKLLEAANEAARNSRGGTERDHAALISRSRH